MKRTECRRPELQREDSIPSHETLTYRRGGPGLLRFLDRLHGRLHGRDIMGDDPDRAAHSEP